MKCGVPQTKKKSNEHREKGKNVDVIADTAPTQCAEGCTALKLKCDDCEDTCENELMRKLAPLCDESKDEFVGADAPYLRPRYLKDIVGKKLLPLDDCGNIDCAALIAWELPGLLIEYSKEVTKGKEEAYSGEHDNMGPAAARCTSGWSRRSSNPPRRCSRRDSTRWAKRRRARTMGPGADLGGEPQDDGEPRPGPDETVPMAREVRRGGEGPATAGRQHRRGLPGRGADRVHPAVRREDGEHGARRRAHPRQVDDARRHKSVLEGAPPPTGPTTGSDSAPVARVVTKGTINDGGGRHAPSEGRGGAPLRLEPQDVAEGALVPRVRRGPPQGACPLLTPDGLDITEKQPPTGRARCRSCRKSPISWTKSARS